LAVCARKRERKRERERERERERNTDTKQIYAQPRRPVAIWGGYE